MNKRATTTSTHEKEGNPRSSELTVKKMEGHHLQRHSIAYDDSYQLQELDSLLCLNLIDAITLTNLSKVKCALVSSLHATSASIAARLRYTRRKYKCRRSRQARQRCRSSLSDILFTHNRQQAFSSNGHNMHPSEPKSKHELGK